MADAWCVLAGSPSVRDVMHRRKSTSTQGSDVSLGISSPPAWRIAERCWGKASCDCHEDALVLNHRRIEATPQGGGAIIRLSASLERLQRTMFPAVPNVSSTAKNSARHAVRQPRGLSTGDPAFKHSLPSRLGLRRVLLSVSRYVRLHYRQYIQQQAPPSRSLLSQRGYHIRPSTRR